MGIIYKKTGVDIMKYIFADASQMGLPKAPMKIFVNTASKEEKESFKKRSPRYL